jgi:hypothetical protein
VKVSVLCPGFVNTRILDSVRNRPADLADTAPQQPERAEMDQAVRQLLASGLPPERVAEVVFDAVRTERFYVFPSPEWKDRIRERAEEIQAERNPASMSVNDLANPGLPK